jgi:hypothetical protein
MAATYRSLAPAASCPSLDVLPAPQEAPPLENYWLRKVGIALSVHRDAIDVL